ncbi:cation transporter [Paenibacillus sp. FSL K6-2862]|uniref:cation transporter n=1 Tax=Paenibacillus sp. FSL K6-2862 TaxID=2921484 RepID=UPI0030F603ED
MKSSILKIEGMSCQHCVRSIEGALHEIGANGKVDLKKKSVDLTFEESQVSLKQIKESIEAQGYKIQVLEVI